jgi:hypothetical protein
VFLPLLRPILYLMTSLWPTKQDAERYERESYPQDPLNPEVFLATFMAVFDGRSTPMGPGPCPEYTLVSDNVVFVIAGKLSDSLIPLAHSIDFSFPQERTCGASWRCQTRKQICHHGNDGALGMGAHAAAHRGKMKDADDHETEVRLR